MKTYFVKGIVVSFVEDEVEQVRGDIVSAETFNDAIKEFKKLYVGELETIDIVEIKQVVVWETI